MSSIEGLGESFRGFGVLQTYLRGAGAPRPAAAQRGIASSGATMPTATASPGFAAPPGPPPLGPGLERLKGTIDAKLTSAIMGIDEADKETDVLQVIQDTVASVLADQGIDLNAIRQQDGAQRGATSSHPGPDRIDLLLQQRGIDRRQFNGELLAGLKQDFAAGLDVSVAIAARLAGCFPDEQGLNLQA